MNAEAAVSYLWGELFLHFAPGGDDEYLMAAPRKLGGEVYNVALYPANIQLGKYFDYLHLLMFLFSARAPKNFIASR